jgi:hypothetical protein
LKFDGSAVEEYSDHRRSSSHLEAQGSHGFRSYYVLDGGEGVGVAVMIFEDRESANAANDKVLEFVQASLLDLNLGNPEIIAGEVLMKIESDA